MSAILLRVSEMREGGLRLTVEEEDFPAPRRRTYCVDFECYLAIGSPSAGELLTEETLSLLAEAEGRQKACLSAVRALSYGPLSANALCQKLRAKGYDRETSEAAVARMIACGYINEPEQVLRLTTLAVQKKCWGARRILAYLVHKGYPASLVRRVIGEAAETGELDFEEARKRLAEKYLGEEATSEERRALFYKYGH